MFLLNIPPSQPSPTGEGAKNLSPLGEIERGSKSIRTTNIFAIEILKCNKPIGIRVKIFQICLALVIFSFVVNYPALSQINDTRAGNVKIGLLVQDSSYASAVHGAEMAIKNANEKGGLRGLTFQLVYRSMEGPWGTGSKQAVSLIFEEKVWALIGLHDGRNAHLVEQAATKSQVVFLSAWSGDPTLSQAFVPWFFNCFPNDNQQAASLFKEIYEIRRYRNIVVVHGKEYDSEKSFGSFMNFVKMKGKPDPLKLNLEDYVQKPGFLAEKIREARAGCIVLFCQPSVSVKLVREIKKENPVQPVFGSLTILNENALSVPELKDFDNFISVPAGDWPEAENKKFRQEFEKKYGYVPGIVASYSYDGLSVLIEAIKIAGTNDRELIQKSLQKINYRGVTGSVQFDGKGNRMGNFEIKKTMNGLPVNNKNEIHR
jgi:branched-chain amino acid transport system substrate-binding protein